MKSFLSKINNLLIIFLDITFQLKEKSDKKMNLYNRGNTCEIENLFNLRMPEDKKKFV